MENRSVKPVAIFRAAPRLSSEPITAAIPGRIPYDKSISRLTSGGAGGIYNNTKIIYSLLVFLFDDTKPVYKNIYLQTTPFVGLNLLLIPETQADGNLRHVISGLQFAACNSRLVICGL